MVSGIGHVGGGTVKQCKEMTTIQFFEREERIGDGMARWTELVQWLYIYFVGLPAFVFPGKDF